MRRERGGATVRGDADIGRLQGGHWDRWRPQSAVVPAKVRKRCGVRSGRSGWLYIPLKHCYLSPKALLTLSPATLQGQLYNFHIKFRINSRKQKNT